LPCIAIVCVSLQEVAFAQTTIQPVRVENVPLPITGNVGLIGTPQVGVSGSVTVNNTSPIPVAIEGHYVPIRVTVTNPNPSVAINNPSTSPIPVTGNVNATLSDPAKTAFVGGYNIVSTGSGYFNLATVPVGNRLVIETVSVNCSAPQGSAGPYLVQILTYLAPNLADQFVSVPMQSQGIDDAGNQYFVGNLSTKFYADSVAGIPGYKDVSGIVNSRAGNIVSCAWFIIGYLVPLP
jgi:hypothetical protein